MGPSFFCRKGPVSALVGTCGSPHWRKLATLFVHRRWVQQTGGGGGKFTRDDRPLGVPPRPAPAMLHSHSIIPNTEIWRVLTTHITHTFCHDEGYQRP